MLQTPSAKMLATKSFSVSVAQILDGRARQYEHIAAHAPVLDAVERMSVNAVGSLIVLNAGCMEGIVTERDVLTNIPRIMQQQDKRITVDSIMTRHPVTVDASATVGECMAIMSHNNFRHLPVTDEGELVGVLSIRDLVDQVAKDHQDEVSELHGQVQKLASVLGADMVHDSPRTWPSRLRQFLPKSMVTLS